MSHVSARRISTWTARRLLVACVLWILGTPVLAALGLLLGGLVIGKLSGSQNYSFHLTLTGWTAGVWLLIPPIALVGVWLWSRDGVQTGEKTAPLTRGPRF